MLDLLRLNTAKSGAFCDILAWLLIVFSMVQCCTVQFSMLPSTVQYAVQCSIVQYSTVQHTDLQ